MSTEEKFLAAVDVVNSIPYDGTFEPSEEIMLKFYGFYKQATEGPCNEPKPFIWSTALRSKWNAWNDLGDMTGTKAMESYVEELSKVIETMSYNEKIAKFLSLMGSFYEIVTSEADFTVNQSSLNESLTEQMMPATFLNNYQPPTISDLYNIIKSENPSSCDAVETHEEKYATVNQNLHVKKYHHPKPLEKVYSQSSLSSSSSASEISDFDLLSNSSDEIVIQQNSSHLSRKSQPYNTRQMLTKQDLFCLTFINLQNSMEDVLQKIGILIKLAEQRNNEINYTNSNCENEKWDLNFTRTAFMFLWPVIIGTVFA